MNDTIPAKEIISEYARQWCLEQHYSHDLEFLWLVPIIALVIPTAYVLLIHSKTIADHTEFSEEKIYSGGKHMLFFGILLLIGLMIAIIRNSPIQ